MKTIINKTSFGSITVNQEDFDHDIIISLSGKIGKRKKKLSKKIYGTSHRVSLDEAKYVFEKGADFIIIGCGQSGQLQLSEEAEKYFSKKLKEVIILPTPEAINAWNTSGGKKIGLFHLTC
jgi:hypothetical protein